MELQLLRESGSGEESFQSADAHIRRILESHMIGDTGGDGVDIVIRKAEATENLFRHTGADSFMPKETNSPIRVGFGGARFADVVQQSREGENGRGLFQMG